MEVREGDTIRVHYIGRLEDGSVFDTSEGGTCIEFQVGKGDLIRAFEQGVIGMGLGETRVVRATPEEAYGLHHKEKVFDFDRSRAPENFDPEVGQQLQLFRADGEPVLVTVISKSEKAITMDANHPLAGKELVFEIRVEEIL